jgi:hypothetical protein
MQYGKAARQGTLSAMEALSGVSNFPSQHRRFMQNMSPLLPLRFA